MEGTIIMPRGTTLDGREPDQSEENREAARRNQAGQALRYLERRGYAPGVDGFGCLDIRIKVADIIGGSHLAIIRGFDGEGRPIVAFHSSEDILGCLSGLYAKLLEGTIKWKPDQFRQ